MNSERSAFSAYWLMGRIYQLEAGVCISVGGSHGAVRLVVCVDSGPDVDPKRCTEPLATAVTVIGGVSDRLRIPNLSSVLEAPQRVPVCLVID